MLSMRLPSGFGTSKDMDDVEDVLHQLDSGSPVDVAKLQGVLADVPLIVADRPSVSEALLTVDDIAEFNNGTYYEELGEDVSESGASPSLLQEAWLAAGKPWQGGVVNYCYASDLSPAARAIFKRAKNFLKQTLPCLTFRNVGWRAGDSQSRDDLKCKKHPAIFVKSSPNSGCYSYVGQSETFARNGFAQPLQLQSRGCTYAGIAVHELSHALGMAHEHQRPDRDRFLSINWDNVRAGKEHNFDIYLEAYTGNQYDYLSIMHYGGYSFAANRSIPTLTTKSGAVGGMGQRSGLAASDVEQLAAMYTAKEAQVPGGCPACVDLSNFCPFWAVLGECSRNRDYMGWACRTSCGLCRARGELCADLHVACGAWASQGQCDENPGYMWLNCIKSCGRCL